MRHLPLLALLLIPACTASPTNPSFPVTFEQADRALDDMAARPRPLQRPLVIIGGFLDPNLSPPYFKWRISQLTSTHNQYVTVSPGFCNSFAECRQLVIDAVDRAFPSADPNFTTEVDVLGASLGGLVARHAAAPSPDPTTPRRLKIARLFTIASPHAGATLATRHAVTDFHKDMRPNSPFLTTLATHDPTATYSLFAYTRLDDQIVGERNAAPPGQTPYWLGTPPLQLSHAGAMLDPRILADIVKRLRNEPAFTTTPPAPLPPRNSP
ncbi:MAG TPA: hypothetical protein VEA69_25250 [Tepidisphaeraceae bacterium]|nr:hypothetical protein [Tepidisphaeraceae bacterium]